MDNFLGDQNIMREELTEEQLAKLEAKVTIMVGKDGIPSIIIPPTFPMPPIPMRKFEIHFFEFEGQKPKRFTELQKRKEINFLEEVLRDLEEMFKGWL